MSATSDLKIKLDQFVEGIGDFHGSETTSSGTVTIVQSTTMPGALAELLEATGAEEYDSLSECIESDGGSREKDGVEGLNVITLDFATEFAARKLDEDDPEDDESEPEDEEEEDEDADFRSAQFSAHQSLCKLIEPYKPVYAQVGGKLFDEANPSCYGLFFHCLLVVIEDTNYLITFPCVHT